MAPPKLAFKDPMLFARSGHLLLICDRSGLGDEDRPAQGWTALEGYTVVRPLQVWAKWRDVEKRARAVPWDADAMLRIFS